jgi:hypothetical protein
MPSENPKALSLKEHYFYGIRAFYEYIVHGTVPEDGSLAIASQRVSTFVHCAPKALVVKLTILEALASAETKTLRSAKNEAKAAKAKNASEVKPLRKKTCSARRERAFWQKTWRFVRKQSRAASGWIA